LITNVRLPWEIFYRDLHSSFLCGSIRNKIKVFIRLIPPINVTKIVFVTNEYTFLARTFATSKLFQSSLIFASNVGALLSGAL
jgi:hypothetical protein